VASDGSFNAPLELAYPYARTVGPTYQRFLGGLAGGQLLGTRAGDGSVVVPAGEFDPLSGAPLTEWVEVGPEATVVSWSWEPSPDASSPLAEPFAWVLVRPDGADTAMVHACAASGPEAMSVGMRVRARFAPGATPEISALACFEPVGNQQEAKSHD
jgi:uncharacterized OB-fold protein